MSNWRDPQPEDYKLPPREKDLEHNFTNHSNTNNDSLINKLYLFIINNSIVVALAIFGIGIFLSQNNNEEKLKEKKCECQNTPNKTNGASIIQQSEAVKEEKQATTSCERANLKDTCDDISVACQKQDKETGTKTGKIVDKLEHKDGVAYEEDSKIPFTGKLLIYHDNGEKYTENNYKAGKKEGLPTKWYKNKKKKKEVNYRAGKREGVYTHWYDTGKKKYEGKYKAGKKVGFHYQWDKNGTLIYNKDHR